MTDIPEELAQIQAQLVQLEADRAATASKPDQPNDMAACEALPGWLSELLDEEGELDADAVLATIREAGSEWLDGFNEDLSSVKPSSLLAIFAFGVLVGKLT